MQGNQQNVSIYLFLLLLLGHGFGWEAEWVRLNPTQRITPRRSGLVPLTNSHVPMIFGGYAEEDTKNDDAEGKPYRRFVTNDLWEWKNDEKTWRLVDTVSGNVPAPRLVGTASVVDNKAYLIGGWNSDAKDPQDIFLDTVHELDLVTKEWKLWTGTVLPDGPASRHVAVALPDRGQILVHTHRCIDFVWLLDIASQQFIRQPTTGPCPSPRGLHAACPVKDNGKIVVFGGAAQDQTMSNQVFVLDTQTWEWSELIPSKSNKQEPEPRASPCMCAVDDEHVVIFGGAQATEQGLKPHGDVWLFSLTECVWTLLLPSASSSSDMAPPPRNAAVLFPLNTNNKNNDGDAHEILLTGGWAPFVETHDDCHVLRVY